MKTNQKWHLRAGKTFFNSSVWFLLLLFAFSCFTYLGCVFDKSGLKGGIPLTTNPPPDGCAGQYYYYDVNSYFGVYGFSPFPQYQMTAGSLPPGLGLDINSGIISGVPTLTGDFDFQIQAIDSTLTVLASGDFRIRIHDFSIVTALLPPICSGTAYTAIIDICGGVPPFTWETVDWDPGVLPLNFTVPGPADSRQNTLTGIPDNPGVYTFNIRVTDSRGDAFHIEKEFKLEITDELTILTARHLPTGVVGVLINQPLEACGGVVPYIWEAVASWPSFLTLDSNSGVISGTPTAQGAYLFRAKLTDSNGLNTEKFFSLTVATSPLEVSGTGVSCLECAFCSHDLSTMLSGGLGVPLWQLAVGSVLPPELVLSMEGILSGLATTPGTYNFNVMVFDGTIDPLNPPESTVTVTVLANPADSGVIIERSRQWPANPANPEYQPPDRINLSAPRGVKFDFRITDANWESTWNAMVPTPQDPVERRQVNLKIVGLCGVGISTNNIRIGDPDGDGIDEHVAIFALWDPLIQDFVELITAAGGIDQSPFTFRIQLVVPESMSTLAVDRIENIVVVDEP